MCECMCTCMCMFMCLCLCIRACSCSCACACVYVYEYTYMYVDMYTYCQRRPFNFRLHFLLDTRKSSTRRYTHEFWNTMSERVPDLLTTCLCAARRTHAQMRLQIWCDICAHKSDVSVLLPFQVRGLRLRKRVYLLLARWGPHERAQHFDQRARERWRTCRSHACYHRNDGACRPAALHAAHQCRRRHRGPLFLGQSRGSPESRRGAGQHCSGAPQGHQVQQMCRAGAREAAFAGSTAVCVCGFQSSDSLCFCTCSCAIPIRSLLAA